MNEQEFVKSIEEANTIEEVWEAASKAGMDKASFDAVVETVQKQQGDEISEGDLENVSGGIGGASYIIGGPMIALITMKALKRLIRIVKK